MTKNTGSPTTPTHTRSFTLIMILFGCNKSEDHTKWIPPLIAWVIHQLVWVKSTRRMLLSISAIFSPKRSQFQNHWRYFYRQRTDGLTGALYECVVNRYFLTSVYSCKGLQILHWYVWDRAAHYSAQHAPVCHPDTSKTIIGDGNRPVTLQPVKMAELSLSSPQIGSVMKGKNGL